jgi:hypothetical protein
MIRSFARGSEDSTIQFRSILRIKGHYMALNSPSHPAGSPVGTRAKIYRFDKQSLC